MASEAISASNPEQLLRMANGVVFHQALYAAAKLGLADLLNGSPQSIPALASQIEVNEGALYRTLRLLASQGVFEETSAGNFRNTDLSYFLRTGVPGSIRALMIFRGSEFFFAPFGEILYSIRTGLPAREKLYGMNAFDYLRDNPDVARIFGRRNDKYVGVDRTGSRKRIRFRRLEYVDGCWRRQRNTAG